jgi:hypothetical protein
MEKVVSELREAGAVRIDVHVIALGELPGSGGH